MPGQESGGGDESVAAQLARQEPGQGGQECPVGPGWAGWAQSAMSITVGSQSGAAAATADVLRRVLLQNYVITTDAAGREVIRAREADTDGLPPASIRLTSPYDLDARWAAKGDDLYWNGYKVHVTETCDLPEPAPGDGDPGGGDPGDLGHGPRHGYARRSGIRGANPDHRKHPGGGRERPQEAARARHFLPGGRVKSWPTRPVTLILSTCGPADPA